MRSLLLACLSLLVVAAPARATSCITALRVDGHLLIDSLRGSAALPLAGEVAAEVPRCDGDDAAEDVVARRVRGLPATVGVEHRGDVYLAEGSMPMVDGHPLQALTRPRRRRGCRRVREPLTGRAEEAGLLGLAVRGHGPRPRWLYADGRTRITNQPAYRVVVHGQSVSVRASRCRGGWFADRIAFSGTALTPDRHGPGPSWWWIALGAFGAAVAAGGLRRRR
jgi:hypothetical protein